MMLSLIETHCIHGLYSVDVYYGLTIETQTTTTSLLHWRTHGGFSYLVEHLDRDIRLRVKKVQDVAGMLDSVLGRLFWGGEAVVARTVEIFEATGVVL